MKKVFISYNRKNESSAKFLFEDIEALGHSVLIDKNLHGGSEWWNKILEMIRDCDLLAFILSQQTLDSTACLRELKYASDIGKPILPVLIEENISINILPVSLSLFQFIDYRDKDRNSAFRLARAIASLSSHELPKTMPSVPEPPIPYLTKVAEQIYNKSLLDYKEQCTLLVDLKRGLGDSNQFGDCQILLQKLSRRRDLYASVAKEIEEILNKEYLDNQDTVKTNAKQNTLSKFRTSFNSFFSKIFNRIKSFENEAIISLVPQLDPDTLIIDILINNYKVIDHRLLTSYEGSIRYTEYYSDGRNVFIRLDPIPENDFYWIAKLPNIESGPAFIYAKKYNANRYNDLTQLPERISIRIVVENSIIKTHTINNHSEKTIGLYIDKDGLTESKSGLICIIKSKIFNGVNWEMILPVGDGTFDLIANLKKSVP